MKRIKLFEEFSANSVTCDNCGWDWQLEDGGHDVFICHECGHDNSPESIHESEETYNDYPESAKNNAKKALKWAEKNGWGTCGTQVGKIRANQLANGENITRDTISRMASFERHRENSKGDPKKDCGALMWLAWGGSEGIEWAQRKLKELKGE